MKNKRFKIAMLALVLGFFSANEMNAQQRSGDEGRGKKRPSMEELFKQMDKNEDGKLSKKELKGPLKNDFDKIDANEDGFITKEELEKAPKPERKERPRN